MYRTILLLLFVALSPIFLNAQFKPIEIYSEVDSRDKRNNQLIFFCNNRTPGKKLVTVKFSELINLRVSSGRDEMKSTVSPGKSRIFTASKINDLINPKYKSRSSWIWGCKNTKHDRDAVYLLPLKEGKSVKTYDISYFGERMNLNTPKDFYSIGFIVEQGDTVYAARKGIVVETLDEIETKKGNVIQFKDKKNYIMVQHSDCTMAKYNDLGTKQILVKPGDKIFPGQAIAVVGNTDYIYKNHIKFSVFYPFDLEKIKNGEPTGEFHKYAYVKPNFLTDKGIHAIDEKDDFNVVKTTEVITSEMSRKEKKKFAKGKLF